MTTIEAKLLVVAMAAFVLFVIITLILDFLLSKLPFVHRIVDNGTRFLISIIVSVWCVGMLLLYFK